MNVNSIVTKDYENIYPCGVRKNKPNSNPISEKPKMNVNSIVTKDYENQPLRSLPENKPNFQRPKTNANSFAEKEL